MRLRFCLLFIFYFSVSPEVYSQERAKVDSLIRLIKNSKEDSSKVDLINILAHQYISNNPDSTMTLTNLSIALAEKINYKKGVAEAHRYRGVVNDNQGEFDKSLEEFFTAIRIFQSINDKKGIASSNNDIGIIYYEQGKYDSALKIFSHTLEMKKELKDSTGIANVTSNIGLVFHDLGNYEEALKQYYSALKIDDARNNSQGMADSYLNIADIYINENNYSKAIETYQTSLQLQQKLGDKYGMAESYTGLGKCFQNLNNLKKAMDYYEKSLRLYEEIDLKLGIASCHGRMGTVYQKQGNYDKALEEFSVALKINEEVGSRKDIIYSHINLGNIFVLTNKSELAIAELNLALNMATQAGLKSAMQESYIGFARTYASKKDFQKAYDSYLKYSEIKDTLLNAQRSKQLAQLQTQYESEKKDQQIALLNAKNMLQESENKKQKLLRNSFIAGFGLIVLLTLLLLNRYRIKQRSGKALEQAYHHLQQTQQQLVQSEKMASLGQLTAGVAHEINNPINFVSANVNPLKRNFAELVDVIKNKKELSADELNYTISETHQLLTGIEEGSRRTAEIVKGLRNFSRLDEEEMKKSNINEGIESTLMILRNKFSEKNIEVIKSLNDIPEIKCYPGQLNQVFMNLITNAIDAAGDYGKIFVTTSKENNRINISIRDTGQGMSEEVKKKIFDPFFTTKDVGKGTGLGLSISYGIIEKHGGQIEVQSEVGKGSEFVIMLPV